MQLINIIKYSKHTFNITLHSSQQTNMQSHIFHTHKLQTSHKASIINCKYHIKQASKHLKELIDYIVLHVKINPSPSQE